jgi:TonB-linked outer membrane protein, SusC/RagA family
MNYFTNIKPHRLKNLWLHKVFNIMKCTTILFAFSCLLSFTTNSYSQTETISLNVKDKTVKEVLSLIEEETEFYFTYNPKEVNIARKVSVSISKENVYDALGSIFDSEKVGYVVEGKHISLYKINENTKKSITEVQVNQQQGIKITGTVVDETDMPIPGVSVSVKGTTIGIITDADGTYSINVPNANAVIMFSYIGYTTIEQTVGSQKVINIIMSEATLQMDEVVVVGYGTQKRGTLTGAVASVGATEIMTTKSENLVANIQGKVPGLLYRPNSGEPGDFDMSLSIRGFGTPVIVIDGIVRNRGGAAELAQLNPEDIESISILKDGSAAIYGMNAANGVLIVTTKKGGEGKVRFSYSGMVGFKSPVALPATMTAYDHRLISNEMARNIGNQPVIGDDELENFRQGIPGYTDWDWMDLYFHDITPPSFTHNISARGGSEKLSFFTSLGYNSDKGIIKSNIQNYDRYTLRSNVTAALTNNLKMNVMMSGRLDNRQAMRGGFFDIYKVVMTNDRGIGPVTPTGHYTVTPPEDINPEVLVSMDANGYRKWRNTTVNTQIDFTYSAPFLKGLDINLLGAFDINNRNYSQLQRQADLYDYREDVFVKKSLTINQYNSQMNLYDKGYVKLQANYSVKLGGHSIAIMGAAEASQERFDNLQGRRSYSDIFTIDVLDMATQSTQQNSGSREFRRYAAYIGRINYDYQGKYLVEGMVRRDGSYRYAPNKRWALFPSVSIGWRVSEEAFFKNNISFINNLKLRASYGESGRDQGSAFQYVEAYTSDNNRNYIFEDGGYIVGMRPPGVVNDRLSWVTAKFYNLAADMDFMKSKLTTTIEFFQRFNTGLLASRITEVPNTFGASFPDENINSDMNIGLELSMKYRDKIGDIRYSVGANITFARTKRQHVERAPFTSQWDEWRNSNEDRYTGRGLLYEYDGHYTSREQLQTAPLHGGNNGNYMMMPGSYRILDLNGDGRISGEDQQYIGWSYGTQAYLSGGESGWDGSTWNRVNPPLQFGFPIEVSYKSFDVNMLFTGSSLFALNINPGDVWGYGRFPSTNARFEDRWRPANPEADRWDPNTEWIGGTYAPLRTSNTGTTDGNMTVLHRPKVTYLRMKSVELGYTFPKSFLNQVGIDNARFYVNGFNLVTFASKLIRSYDPEKHEGDWDVGLSNPSMRSMNVGLNITF